MFGGLLSHNSGKTCGYTGIGTRCWCELWTWWTMLRSMSWSRCSGTRVLRLFIFNSVDCQYHGIIDNIGYWIVLYVLYSIGRVFCVCELRRTLATTPLFLEHHCREQVLRTGTQLQLKSRCDSSGLSHSFGYLGYSEWHWRDPLIGSRDVLVGKIREVFHLEFTRDYDW